MLSIRGTWLLSTLPKASSILLKWVLNWSKNICESVVVELTVITLLFSLIKIRPQRGRLMLFKSYHTVFLPTRSYASSCICARSPCALPRFPNPEGLVTDPKRISYKPIIVSWDYVFIERRRMTAWAKFLRKGNCMDSGDLSRSVALTFSKIQSVSVDTVATRTCPLR